MSKNHFIQCPDCNHTIYYNTAQLLTGSIFSCSNPDCSITVSLSKENNEKSVKAIQEFNNHHSQTNGAQYSNMN